VDKAPPSKTPRSGKIVTPEAWEERFRTGAECLGLRPAADLGTKLRFLQEELLKWNQKVNLTAIVSPEEILEKHFLDSLAVLPELAGVATLLDVGAGAGLPGIPLKLAAPALEVTLVDAVAKKVAFIRQGLIRVGATVGARAVHAHLSGDPERERLPPFDAAISRALMDVGAWASLARHYVKPGGRVISMVGRLAPQADLELAASSSSLSLRSVRQYELPFSRAERAVIVFCVPT
jgi:16S rRNA (guanine527-N7)-methyltransferase